MKSNFIDRAEAIVVADVLATVAELREASTKALKWRREADEAHGAALFEHHRARKAEEYVAELTGRISARTSRDGMNTNHIIALAEAVLDGRRSLPAGVEVLEVA